MSTIWTAQYSDDVAAIPDVTLKYPLWNVRRAYQVGTRLAPPGSMDYDWDPVATEAWIEANVPEEWNGALIFIHETNALGALNMGSGDPNNAAAQELFSDIADLLTSLRPNALVGSWDVPGDWFDDPDPSDFHAAMIDILPTLRKMRAFYPRSYIADPNIDDPLVAEQARYCLELSNDHTDDHPQVLPYCWHELKGGLGWAPRTAAAHIASVRAMQDVSHEGRHIDGVVAWGADKFYHGEYFAQDDPGACGYNICGDDGEAGRSNFTTYFSIYGIPTGQIDAFIGAFHPDVYSWYAEALGIQASSFPTMGLPESDFDPRHVGPRSFVAAGVLDNTARARAVLAHRRTAPVRALQATEEQWPPPAS